MSTPSKFHEFQLCRGHLTSPNPVIIMRISKRGQITIPKHLRERFGLDQNVEVVISPTNEGLLIRKRPGAEHPVDRVAGILDGIDFDIDGYIEEIRGR